MTHAPATHPLARLCWVVLPTACVLLASELVLGALGLGEPVQQVDRGFSSNVSYLLPKEGSGGAFRTQMFQGEEPEIDIPRKDARARVVLFGGSNTARFPHGNLQGILNERYRDALDAHAAAREAKHEWEVINLGRSGYGSARVRILFEQAFAIEPDLVVVYSGHNEFVELGFEMQIAHEWNALERPLAGAASRLRAFHVLVAMFENGARAPAGRSPVQPERSQFEHDKFRSFRYTQTLDRMRAYEANLDAMCALAEARGVPLLLGTLFSNDLSAPFVSNIDPAVGLETRRAVLEALQRAHDAWPERWAGVWPKDPPDVLNLGDWAYGDSGADATAPPLRAMPGALASVGPLWDEPSKWRPRTHELMRAWSEFHRGPTAQERERLVSVERELAAILERVPDHPLAHYLLGLCVLARGDAKGAREHLALAARFDRAPLKASSLSNEIVRRVAARHANVRVFDFDARTRERAPDGIIGFELMQDHCHAHARTYQLLMRDLAADVAAAWRERGGSK